MKVTGKVVMPAGVRVDGRLPVVVDREQRSGSARFEITNARLVSPGGAGPSLAEIEVTFELDVKLVLDHRHGLRGSPNSNGIVAMVETDS